MSSGPTLTSFMRQNILYWEGQSHPSIMVWRCLHSAEPRQSSVTTSRSVLPVWLCSSANAASLNVVHWSVLWWITQRQLSLRTNKAFVCVAAGQPVAKLLWLMLMRASQWYISFEYFLVVSFHFHMGDSLNSLIGIVATLGANSVGSFGPWVCHRVGWWKQFLLNTNHLPCARPV